MRTTILQPTYLPWLGYFEMIDQSQQYVVFDHVQFSGKSWQQRNRIRGPGGVQMLSIPVLSDGRQEVAIKDKRIDYQQPWIRKHLKSIKLAYQHAPFFKDHYDPIAEVLERRPERLVDLTESLIRHFIACLGISVQVRRSSEILREDDSQLDKTMRVVNLCEAAGASVLYDGAAAADFLCLDRFNERGIQVIFQHYQHPEYPQQGNGPFQPYMSIADLLFNCGPDSLRIVRSGAGR